MSYTGRIEQIMLEAEQYSALPGQSYDGNGRREDVVYTDSSGLPSVSTGPS